MDLRKEANKMSLMIKGLEMPCMCCVCPCHDWDMEANRYYCQALKDEPRIIDENTRRGDCPLAEIPSPHGDLIDKEPIKKFILDGINKPAPESFGYDGIEILSEIEFAPAIIEEEK